jgi:nucleotide-binding universal stress UspA family protein
MQDTLILPESEMISISASRLSIDTQSAAFAQLPSVAVKRILLPFDLSQSSVCTLRAVANFATKAGASIHLVHVVRPPEKSDIEPKANRSDDIIAEASERLLKHWVKRVIQDRVQTFVCIRIGEPVDVIVARAVATGADLIVMTSRSCSGLKNKLQRSDAERVSRLAPCPVLTIPEKSARELAYSLESPFVGNGQTILLPVDFSTAAEKSLRIAVAIALENGARLLLAHGSESADLDESAVHARIESWAQRILNETMSFQTAVWPGGHSLYAILSEALRAEATLIVLPTRAQSWACRLRAGSITDGVLRQAPCPVLSINENTSGPEI